jgi:hypothetical protein
VRAGLRSAVLGQIDVIGITQVTDLEQSMAQSAWIVVVLSPAYLADTVKQQELLFAGSLGMDARINHLLPVYITPQVELQLPKHLELIRGCDLSHPETTLQEFKLLIQSLRATPASFERLAPQIPKSNPSVGGVAVSAWNYDVFVIFSYDDAAWVERELLPHLDAQGLRLCVAFHDFAPGASTNEADQFIQTSRKTLLVLTSAFLRSDWNQWKHSLSHVSSNNGGDIVAFLESGRHVPQELRLFPIVHFETQSGRERTWQRLLQALLDDRSSGVIPEYTHDVFVACGQADLEWTRTELLPRLMQSGLRCFIAHRDFAADQPVAVEYERVLRASRRTLLLLTRDYLAQGWSDFDAALQKAPIHREYRLIPLIEVGCALPVRISDITGVSFVKQMSLAWEQLLRALAYWCDSSSPIFLYSFNKIVLRIPLMRYALV